MRSRRILEKLNHCRQGNLDRDLGDLPMPWQERAMGCAEYTSLHEITCPAALENVVCFAMLGRRSEELWSARILDFGELAWEFHPS